MKVEWKRFDKDDQKTWPEHNELVWVYNEWGFSLVIIDRSSEGQIFFDVFGAHGSDCEPLVQERCCICWKRADLPKKPEFPL
jgi:hypothetical protein